MCDKQQQYLEHDLKHEVQVAAGNSMTLVGFTIHARSPSAALLPNGTLAPLNITFQDAGLPVQNLLGGLIPNFLAFAAPQPDAEGASTLTLTNMQLVYDTCDQSWQQITHTLAVPSAVCHLLFLSKWPHRFLLSMLPTQHLWTESKCVAMPAHERLLGSCGQPTMRMMITEASAAMRGTGNGNGNAVQIQVADDQCMHRAVREPMARRAYSLPAIWGAASSPHSLGWCRTR